MSHIMGSPNETAAFRHYFHYYHFVREGARLTRPELTELTANHYEAELLAYQYREYRNAISENAFKGLPSGS
jgi:hypothetical protein